MEKASLPVPAAPDYSKSRAVLTSASRPLVDRLVE